MFFWVLNQVLNQIWFVWKQPSNVESHREILLVALDFLMDSSQPVPPVTHCRDYAFERHCYQMTDLVYSTTDDMGFPTVHQNHSGDCHLSPPAGLSVLAVVSLVIRYK